MTAHLPAILLAVLNVLLIWLLMAVPVGRRKLTGRLRLAASADMVWEAVSPRGRFSAWHYNIISSLPVPGDSGLVEQRLTAPDRHGEPIKRVLRIDEQMDSNERRLVDVTVVEDSALDISFWKDFHELFILDDHGNGVVTLTIERTDRYRGLAFLIFRYFALQRELKALRHWIETGRSERVRMGFEHPLVQTLLAVLSTLILWPFFGITVTGLLLSALLTVVIVMHELGHMAAYRAFGHRSTRMIFVPLLGGVAIGGRPYNSLFEVASCALMGAGMSAFLVPVAIALHQAWGKGAGATSMLFFLLILGAFNLLNLLPMNRFDGGQVLRQVFPGSTSLAAGSFVVTGIVLSIGWRIGVPQLGLLAALAIFALLSLMGHRGVKPRHRLDDMTSCQRLVSGLGLYAALALHGYALVYATDRLFA
ncbi:Zn-dependent protease [Pararhizobium capsulatum DSM 1112]|uniref:Zn-dependent protease n=1 Tax=Pararhizobium capsulatum DSM 1112 TaxID=1121113 RepID=A0ABU0BQG4_9HYPH|nr:hypothetical protein [Pararhizobium capsulatum]MDQ0319989.1 Zn-dependent protease [Pararhizobium capsulatum DSM 1112]